MKQYIPLTTLVILLSLNSFAQINDSHNRKSLSIDPSKAGLVDVNSNPEIQRLSELKSNLTSAQKKLSTDLVQLIDQKFLPSVTGLQSHVNSMIKLNQIKLFEQGSNLREKVTEGSVYVYIFLYEGFTTYSLDGFAGEITNRDEKNNMAVAWVKVNKLEELASLNAVRTIRTVFPPIIRTGSVTTEGDGVHRTSNVRSTYGEDGTGINVGIISDGVTNRASSQATGDLPMDGSGLTVLDAGSGDEGTAMLEIVHDMAPGAGLFFHSAGGSTLAFNAAIDDLISNGCDIICDDVGWITQPFYEDGIVAQHVNSVITPVNNIIYVSSCGNAGESHYQGDYFPIPLSTQHDFSEGGTTGYYLYLNLAVGENARLVLQWDDPFGGSGNDYDLYFARWTGSAWTIVANSINSQTGTQNPLEFINYTRPAGGPALYDYAIIVDKYLGDPKTLEVFIYAPFNYTNNIIPLDAIFGHPAVDNVVSVGAVYWMTPSTIEDFSSQGPSTIAFPSTDIRQTPKIVGVDGGVITGAGGFGSFDGTNYRFYGTSAAAPHIAAILAQAWSNNVSGWTASQIKQFMFDYPVDIGDPGYDNVYGYGRADALNMFDNTPLPVEFSSFTAKVLRNGGVQLDWITETEVDNYGFEIERSQKSNVKSQSSDEWVMIGFAEGHGNSNSPKEYSYTDNYAQYGSYAYRLKQIDTDGSYEYSDIIEVQAGNIPDGFVLEQNYPNPFNPITTIKFALAETQNAELKVFDVLGNEVAIVFNGIADGGKIYEAVFNAENYSSGIYFYRLETKNRVVNKKMLLLK
jgi:hypothetical protein